MVIPQSDGAALTVVATEVTLVALLAITVGVAILVSRFDVPFTLARVVVGLGLSFTRPSDVSLSKDLILGVLVPPVLPEVTMHLPWYRLKDHLVPIPSLAVDGTHVGMLLVPVEQAPTG